MKIGFTGTRQGMTERQKETFERLMRIFVQSNYIDFHHGGCVGADKEADSILRKIKGENLNVCVGQVRMPAEIIMTVHPGNIEKYRAYCITSVLLAPKPCLERNKDIVYCSQILIACPKTNKEELRSGTWATIRYAREKNVPVIILEP